ncbi:hypothetical protein B0H17DRAFT_1145836 [Mycena rosella]|uniref:Uncharacterized protein n=1 Tax=Mycena rosella TaxID=1033263 RepID=A0AAD7CQ27_MYCRO|nr:hypothetical protein B0H17DRAFT_1145836 [Mycena rosella]
MRLLGDALCAFNIGSEVNVWATFHGVPRAQKIHSPRAAHVLIRNTVIGRSNYRGEQAKELVKSLKSMVPEAPGILKKFQPTFSEKAVINFVVFGGPMAAWWCHFLFLDPDWRAELTTYESFDKERTFALSHNSRVLPAESPRSVVGSCSVRPTVELEGYEGYASPPRSDSSKQNAGCAAYVSWCIGGRD